MRWEFSKSENPIAETIRDISVLNAFVNSLPTFYEGTEDTGQSGNGIDNKGGFHAILHPHERVIPQNLNNKIGNFKWIIPLEYKENVSFLVQGNNNNHYLIKIS